MFQHGPAVVDEQLMSQPSKLVWAGSLVVTAVVVAAGTWFVTDRSEPEPLGEGVADTSSSSSSPAWLFSATAGGGTWTDQPDGTTTLTLTDVDPQVIGFTDRPDRDAVTFATPKLVDAWPTLFDDSAPNAVLVTRDAGGQATSYVLTLSDPSSGDATLSFTAEPVQGEDHSSQLPAMEHWSATAPPAAFADVSLFIDDVSPADAVFSCKNANGALISPPGTMPVIYKPIAPYVKLCQDAGGTVYPKPPS